MNLGERIKKEREKKGLSQQQLSQQLMLSRQAVSSYEVGRTEPDVSTLNTMANYFGVSIDFLVNGNTERKKLFSGKLAVAVFVAVVTMFMGARGMFVLYINNLRVFETFYLMYFVHTIVLLVAGHLSFRYIFKQLNTLGNKTVGVCFNILFVTALVLNISSVVLLIYERLSEFPELEKYWLYQYNNIPISVFSYCVSGAISGLFSE